MEVVKDEAFGLLHVISGKDYSEAVQKEDIYGIYNVYEGAYSENVRF